MKKRFLSLLMVFIMLCAVASSLSVSAYNDIQYGDLYYINENGKIIITDCDRAVTSVSIPSRIAGLPVTEIGHMAFYFCNDLTSVTIPGSVTIIGSGAFTACNSLVSVKMGNGVTTIEDGAFSGCPLTSITIPNSVTTIEGGAFANCRLTSVTISDRVTSIGNGAFANCDSLTSITVDDNNPNYCSVDGNLFSKDKTRFMQYAIGKTDASYKIPDSVTSIDGDAFSYCRSLTSVTIPDSVTVIGGNAFSCCTGLTSITIPEGVTGFEMGTFAGCSSLTSVTLPNTLTNIGIGTFNDCSSLTSVTIPDGVTAIGDYVFWGSGLISVTIPNSVTTIGRNTFSGCNSLTSVTIPDSVSTIDYGAFSGCGGLTGITIPDSVTTIGEDAFSGSGLTDVTIPDSVTVIGGGAFCECGSLTNINVDNNNPNYCSIDGNLFSKDKTELIQYAIGKTDAIYKIPNSVTTVAETAFSYCDNLMSVTISNGMTEIGEKMFDHCYALKTVTIPDSVTTIGYDAFGYCGLTDVYYRGSRANWQKINIDSYNYSLDNAVIHYNEAVNCESISSGIILLAVYDENGVLKGVHSNSFAREVIFGSLNLSIGDSVRAVLWNSLVGMKPLVSSPHAAFTHFDLTVKSSPCAAAAPPSQKVRSAGAFWEPCAGKTALI